MSIRLAWIKCTEWRFYSVPVNNTEHRLQNTGRMLLVVWQVTNSRQQSSSWKSISYSISQEIPPPLFFGTQMLSACLHELTTPTDPYKSSSSRLHAAFFMIHFNIVFPIYIPIFHVISFFSSFPLQNSVCISLSFRTAPLASLIQPTFIWSAQ